MRLRYAAALVLVCLLAGWKWATAQVVGMSPVPPRVMTGAEIGFRIIGLRGDVPVGRFVVRVNDRWVEAEVVPGPALLR
jgi:hypothetical protein